MYQKKLVGVFGDPVDDNPSVVIEQVAFDYMKLPMEYLTIQVKQGDLKAAIEGLRAMNFTGINITMPHKIDVLQYLDYVADDAKIIIALGLELGALRCGKLGIRVGRNKAQRG